MGKSKKRKKPNRNARSKSAYKLKKKSAWGKVVFLKNKTFQVVTFLITIGTVISLYYAFSPKLSISPSIKLDGNNIYKTVFLVKNESSYPVHNLVISSKINKIQNKNNTTLYDFNVKYKKEPISELLSGESTSYVTPEILRIGEYSYGDVEIKVSYRPFFWPFDVIKSHRFITAKNNSGDLTWVPKALAE